MSKKILTLDDLYKFYSEKGKSVTYSAKDENHQLVVSVLGKADFAKTSNDTEGLLPTHLQACHTEQNLNQSFISEKNMKNALSSFSNRPILAYIYKDDNGEYQFRDHAMHMEDDELVYDEKCVGIVPESCNAHLSYDEEKKKTYVEVDGYIFEEYSKAKEILERDGECAVSVELSIRDLAYNAKEKRLEINDFFFSGVTILGKWEDGSDVLPGMAGSNIKIADFQQRNTTFSQDEVIVMLNEIKDKLDQLSINNQGKEVEPEVNLFEQLLEKYGVTAEDVTFEYEGLSDEDLTAKFEEVFGGEQAEMSEESAEDSEGEAETSEDGAEEGTTIQEELQENTEEMTEQDTESSDNASDDASDEAGTYEVKYSVTYGEVQKDFALSLQDKIDALYALVNDTYSDQDGCWYDVTVFEDPKYVIMSDFWSGKGYKQNYKVQKDIYSLVGDRVPVKQVWVTEDEEKQLEQMKANYASMETELNSYHAEPEKMEILNSADYEQISDMEEFVAFKAQDAHFDLSVEEVRAKADEMLLNAAKSGKVDFSKKESDDSKKEVGFKQIPIATKDKKSGRYGSMFSK